MGGKGPSTVTGVTKKPVLRVKNNNQREAEELVSRSVGNVIHKQKIYILAIKTSFLNLWPKRREGRV